MTDARSLADAVTTDDARAGFGPSALVPALLGGLFALVLALVVLREAVGGPEFPTVYQLIFAYLLLGVVGHAAAVQLGERTALVLGGQLSLAGALLALVSLQTAGAPPGVAWGTSLFLTLVLFLGYLLAGPSPAAFVREHWHYLLAFAVLVGISVQKGTRLAPGSGSAMFPIAAGLMMGVNLFVVPRYVSREAVMWALAALSGVVTLVGLVAYLVGQYTLFSLEVQLWVTTFSPPFLPVDVQYLQSIFANPNQAGFLAFAGTFAAFATAHRTVVSESRPLAGALAAGLCLVNGLGLYLTHSRASYLAAAAATVLYLSYVLVGREYLSRTALAIVGLLGLSLLALYAFRFTDPNGRFVLWYAGVRAFLADPTLFGHGIVGTGDLAAPYVDGKYRGQSVHNSYVAILLRTGLVGFVAYLLLTVGSIVDGLRHSDSVDVAALALALGFAVHQLFETYSLFQHNMTAILATLAFGYLIVGPGLVPDADRPGTRL